MVSEESGTRFLSSGESIGSEADLWLGNKASSSGRGFPEMRQFQL